MLRVWESIRRALRLATVITVRKTGSVSILDFSGPMRVGVGDVLLRERVQDLLHDGQSPIVIFNVAGTRLDSACLLELVACKRQIGVSTVSIKKKKHDLFSLCVLEREFDCYPDVEAALGGLLLELTEYLPRRAA